MIYKEMIHSDVPLSECIGTYQHQKNDPHFCICQPAYITMVQKKNLEGYQEKADVLVTVFVLILLSYIVMNIRLEHWPAD